MHPYSAFRGRGQARSASPTLFIACTSPAIAQGVIKSLLRHICAASAYLGPSLCLVCEISTAQAESGADEKSASMQLFVDVVGDELGDAAKKGMQIDLGGVPLVLGAGDGIDGAGLGMTAGVDGNYDIPISNKLKIEGHTKLSKTRYVSDVLFGAANISSEAALRYQNGDLTLTLQPKLGVSFMDAAIDRTDYVVSGRFSKGLVAGWSLTATTSYAWRDSNFVASDTGETAEGAFGLSYDFAHGPRHPSLDLKYQFRRKMAANDHSSSGLQGPSIAAIVPMGDWFEFGANYCYSETTIYDLAGDRLDRTSAESHNLGMTADWYFGGEAAPGLDLKADYNYTYDAAAADSRDDEEHTGMVSLALSF